MTEEMLMYHMTCNCLSVLSDTWLLVSVLTSHHKTCMDGHGAGYTVAITVAIAIGLYTVYCCLKEYKGIEEQDHAMNIFLGLMSNIIILAYWIYGLNQNSCAILKDMEHTFGRVTFCVTCLLSFLRSMEIMLEWMQESQPLESSPVKDKVGKVVHRDNKGSQLQPQRKLKRSMSITEVIIHTCNKTLNSVIPVPEETKKL